MKSILIVRNVCVSQRFWQRYYLHSEWQIDKLCNIFICQTDSGLTIKTIKFKEFRTLFYYGLVFIFTFHVMPLFHQILMISNYHSASLGNQAYHAPFQLFYCSYIGIFTHNFSNIYLPFLTLNKI